MVDTSSKSKAAMLHELESIKGLLLEDDDIPILQEVIEPKAVPMNDIEDAHGSRTETSTTKMSPIIVEEQQDFFDSPKPVATHNSSHVQTELLDTIEELEKQTREVTSNKWAGDLHKSSRPSLAKATGENPFLPAHIRSRLHGNNPPPLFAQETARKIAGSSTPSRLLGNTSNFLNSAPGTAHKALTTQQELIDSIIEKILPELENELRSKLETMSRQLLDELNKQ